ncbi:MAG: ATP-binding cassette domain-containing protein [Cuniculiplasma divulgatum]|nr:MAG: ATP-binding cassette domain-containing protein [Cuniculiplasma divulgatum]
MIELKNYTAGYGRDHGNQAVSDIDFVMGREKSIIVGPNGSGKTTLFRSILGMVRQSVGTAKVLGTDPDNIRGKLKVSTNLPEVYRLISGSVRDIIEVYSELKDSKSDDVYQLLKDYGLSDILKKRIFNLSTGQQKMLCNLLAVSFHPDLVLLDEPFENLDQNRRSRYFNLLNTLDAAVLLNTHELEIVKRLADWYLYFMVQGKLYGKFKGSQIDDLYLNRGEVAGNISVWRTDFGTFSITLGEGSVKIFSIRNLNSIFDEVA